MGEPCMAGEEMTNGDGKKEDRKDGYLGDAHSVASRVSTFRSFFLRSEARKILLKSFVGLFHFMINSKLL